MKEKVNKKILVLCASSRKHGNTDLLSDAFLHGTFEAGHESEKIYIKDKRIHGCNGCGVCQDKYGKCVQKDDMMEIYEKMTAADVIVLASPVYFYTWSAQMKTILDRSFALEKTLTDKTFYLISAGAAPSKDYMETMQKCFEQYVDCFRAGENRIGGSVFGLLADKPGDVSGSDAEKQAYQMGKNVG